MPHLGIEYGESNQLCRFSSVALGQGQCCIYCLYLIASSTTSLLSSFGPLAQPLPAPPCSSFPHTSPTLALLLHPCSLEPQSSFLPFPTPCSLFPLSHSSPPPPCLCLLHAGSFYPHSSLGHGVQPQSR